MKLEKTERRTERGEETCLRRPGARWRKKRFGGRPGRATWNRKTCEEDAFATQSWTHVRDMWGSCEETLARDRDVSERFVGRQPLS